MANLNYLFNKEYYEKLSESQKEIEEFFEKCNKKMIAVKFDNDYDNLLIEHSKIHLKTLYPGMLIGIGYPHEIADSKNQIKLGFSFDYVTGLPYIPSSTVKGVLRSAFRRQYQYIAELLQKQNINISVKEVEGLIFGELCKNEKSNSITKLKDIFFDAVIVKGGKDNRIIGIDFITPHKASTESNQSQNISDITLQKESVIYHDEFSEPNPIKMLKVIPEVVFEFRFKLQDSKVGNINISKEIKLKLFEQILLDIGIGAKTNVGFGSLEKLSCEELDFFHKKELQLKKLKEEEDKKAKELILISEMSDIEQKLYFELKKSKNTEEWLNNEVYGKLDTLESSEKMQYALFLKKHWSMMPQKWNGTLSDKQKIKVEKVKSILQ
jgi:CRISPR-associated protein Cmr6